MVWSCIEKRRRIRREESDGDGGAGKRRRGRPKRGVCITTITSTLARRHQGRNKLHTHRTMRFGKRSRHLEEDDHGNHQKSDAT